MITALSLPAKHLPVAGVEAAGGQGVLTLVEEDTGLGQTVGMGETQGEVEPGLGALLLLSVQIRQVKQTRGVTCRAENSVENIVSSQGVGPEYQSGTGWLFAEEAVITFCDRPGRQSGGLHPLVCLSDGQQT